MNSSNVPFCNLYNRKCDFSPLRAAWRPDFFVMSLCSPFALRYAGQLQAGAQDSRCLLTRAARQSAGAMLAVLRACWPATPQHWCALCLAPDLARPCGCSCGRATSAAICHGYRAPAYLAGVVGQTVHADHCDGFDQALAARHGSTGAARRWHSGCGCNRFRDGLRYVCARAARQRAALRLAAAIVHVAHDCIANP